MSYTRLLNLAPCLLFITFSSIHAKEAVWKIESAEDWKNHVASSDGLTFEKGTAFPSAKSGKLTTQLQAFKSKRSLQSLTISQSAIWQNWNPIENIGPANLKDAPVLLTKGDGDYWIFGMHGNGASKKRGKKGKPQATVPPFEAKPAKLEGFDLPLVTTRYANQFNAPGGLKKSLGGYHAWQSRDMKNWVHHGPVTEGFSRWVTTAEQVDGKTYIYYDYPNDQDPHLYIDSDLTDGKPGENKGLAFADPTHGSDCTFIRDLEGKFNVIFEDWSHINASKRSWDSPVAGRAMSDNGINGFKIMKNVVDARTKPTGEIKTYRHPHWAQHPAWSSSTGKYEVHTPEQPAYGDWASISIGGQYYLFGDYDPAGGHDMSVGWFTSPSLDQQFTWCDHIGKGHPDPDVTFAEGQFYLATQQKVDFVSTGPWVEKVTARVGVDTDNDKKIDQWTEWQALKESYDYMPGYSKQVKKAPAQMDLSNLPAGFGFQIEVQIEDTTKNKSKPILEGLTLKFDPS